MSKIPADRMKSCINEMIKNKKPRKFVETIDLQVGLKVNKTNKSQDYDPNKDKRFSGTVRLAYIPRPKLKVCVIADAAQADKCKAAGIEFIDKEALRKRVDPNDKKGKELKKWSRKYTLLFVSETLIRELPKLGGPFLTKWGKFPTVIQNTDDVKTKVEEGMSSVKFQLKKVLCLGVAVGNCSLTEEQIRQNLNISVNFLVSLLKKGWNNIKSLYIKTTMGKSIKLL